MEPTSESTRFAQYDEIYVSPHFDDAVYSCGGRISQQRKARRRVLVVTVFADGGEGPAFPVARRFGDYQARREEDRAALKRLDADYVWLNHPEFLYRRPALGDAWRTLYPIAPLADTPLRRTITEDLRVLCERMLAPGGQAWFPLAVGFHPDHRIVCDAGRVLHASGCHRVSFYEDVPYAQFPIQRALRLRSLGLSAAIPYPESALQFNAAHAQLFGFPPQLTLLPTLLYLPTLEAIQRLLQSQDRYPDEPAPQLEELPIDDVIDEKVEVARLYASQTVLFMPSESSLYRTLGGGDRLVERSLRFPPFPQAGHRPRRHLA